MKAQILHFDSNRPKTRKCQPAISPQATELATKLDRLIRIYGPQDRFVGGILMQIERMEQRLDERASG
jgi:hypothetical protein